MSRTHKIIQIFKSRKTILELLKTQGYATEDYENFSFNEVDAMYKTNQLDMLLEKPESNNVVLGGAKRKAAPAAAPKAKKMAAQEAVNNTFAPMMAAAAAAPAPAALKKAPKQATTIPNKKQAAIDAAQSLATGPPPPPPLVNQDSGPMEGSSEPEPEIDVDEPDPFESEHEPNPDDPNEPNDQENQDIPEEDDASPLVEDIALSSKPFKQPMKTYVKYYLPEKQKQISKAVLDDIVEDLYVLEEVLTKNDTLIIIMDDEPNDSTRTRLTYLYDKEGIFIVIHNMQRLQFNLLHHHLVPKITALTEEETQRFMKEKQIRQWSQLPEISRFDPQALAISLRPHQICILNRSSPTSLTYAYYRICV